MRIKKLKLLNFRNYTEKEFEFKEKINLISGANGSGKSSLLEAIHILSLGRSFRTSVDQTLVHRHENQLFLHGIFQAYDDRIVDIKFGLEQKKTIKINDAAIPRLSDLIGRIPIILFLDKDIDILEGPPSGRRRFLDLLFSQIDPEYLMNLVQYHKILDQRNHYLKSNHQDPLLMETLNQNLVLSGVKIIQLRMQYIGEFTGSLSRVLAQYDDPQLPAVQLQYRSSVFPDYKINRYDMDILSSCFHSQLLETRLREEKYKYTLIGPHRDDLFFLNQDGSRLVDYSSRGERRLFMLFVKFAEMEFISCYKKDPAIVLMDDILLELDKKNKDFITDSIAKITCQSFITTVDENDYQNLPDKNMIQL
ncbi:MAG: DNA replication and repair protein RecF [bacterium]|nr:DNA replication and repair protein RecF [bacterium]